MNRRLLDLKNAAAYLSLSTRLLEQLIEDDEIPVKHIPGVRRNFFDVRDLDKFADNMLTSRDNKNFIHGVLNGKRIPSR